MRIRADWKVSLLLFLVQTMFSTLCEFRAQPPTEGFFGQASPRGELTPFLPETFSTGGRNGFHLHSSLFFSADGGEVCFTNQVVPVVPGYDQEILVLERQGGKPGEPGTLHFSGTFSDQIFHLSPDGSRLYFTSTRPLDGKGEALDSRNGWISERGADGWSEPRHIASPLDLTENDGTLYVSAEWPGGAGGSDVYRLGYGEDSYGLPENLGPPVNTEYGEYACCWPKDERYIIFYRFHPYDRNIRGLYMSFKKEDGSWTEPIPLSKILGIENAFRATLSPDEKFLFILNRGDGVYWIESRTVEQKAGGYS